jgi:hypothetical protein
VRTLKLEVTYHNRVTMRVESLEAKTVWAYCACLLRQCYALARRWRQVFIACVCFCVAFACVYIFMCIYPRMYVFNIVYFCVSHTLSRSPFQYHSHFPALSFFLSVCTHVRTYAST